MEIEKQQFRPSETATEKERLLRRYNDLQSDLIKISGQKESDWVRENAFNFQKIVESMPEVVELYSRDPEAARKKVSQAMEQKRIYH